MDTKNINLLELVGILGAAVMIIGVFLTWGSIEISTAFGSDMMEWTGWEIFNHVDDISTDADYAPIVALVCGILALISAIVPMFLSDDGYSNIFKLMNLIVTVLGIIALVCMVMFYSGFVESSTVAGIITGTADVGTGFWLCIVGGAITVIGGLLPIAKKIMA